MLGGKLPEAYNYVGQDLGHLRFDLLPGLGIPLFCQSSPKEPLDAQGCCQARLRLLPKYCVF